MLDGSKCVAIEPVATVFDNTEVGASPDRSSAWHDGADRRQLPAIIEFVTNSPDGRSMAWLEAGVDRLALQGEDSEHAFVHATQRFALNEPLQTLDPQCKLPEGQ